MIFFWDFDGPILNVKSKYYSLYKDILIKYKCRPLPIKKYWELKRSKSSIENILLQSDAGYLSNQFKKAWLEKIETSKYLKLDKLQPGIIEILDSIETRYELVIVTLRKNKKQVIMQLEEFGLIDYFKDILTSDLDTIPRWHIKYNMIKYYLRGIKYCNHTIIGDTETDINSGKHLNMRTIAFSSGIRNEDMLKKTNPDYIIKSLHQLYKLI